MSSEDEPQVDPLLLLDLIQPWLESLRGLVAALVNDGFSDQQARDLVVVALKQMVATT